MRSYLYRLILQPPNSRKLEGLSWFMSFVIRAPLRSNFWLPGILKIVAESVSFWAEKNQLTFGRKFSLNKTFPDVDQSINFGQPRTLHFGDARKAKKHELKTFCYSKKVWTKSVSQYFGRSCLIAQRNLSYIFSRRFTLANFLTVYSTKISCTQKMNVHGKRPYATNWYRQT